MSDHTNLPCELLTSSLIRGIQMGEMSTPIRIHHVIISHCIKKFLKKLHILERYITLQDPETSVDHASQVVAYVMLSVACMKSKNAALK
jgi:hypothetical protein